MRVLRLIGLSWSASVPTVYLVKTYHTELVSDSDVFNSGFKVRRLMNVTPDSRFLNTDGTVEQYV